jgi:hypothetical protein
MRIRIIKQLITAALAWWGVFDVKEESCLKSKQEETTMQETESRKLTTTLADSVCD